MRSAVVFCVLALLAVAAYARPVLDDDIIATVNARGHWKAGRNARFENVALEDAMRLLGSRQRESHLPKRVHNLDNAVGLPDTFDARVQWPNCIHPIRNQEQCGSCWAFGATEVLSDRLCIQHGVNVVLSPQDLVSCDKTDLGCDGGYLDHAWQYMVKEGVVADKCMPYTSSGGASGTCPADGQCTGTGPWQKYHAASAYDVSASVANIQQEIFTNGPVEGAFDVYQDFFQYKSGVYYHQTGGLAGGHAIKILGWGTEGGVDYWLCANSWGPNWGDNGFFKIKRGTNECLIESGVVAGMAAASSSVAQKVLGGAELLDEEAPVLSEEIVRHVNAHAGSWKARHNERFAGMSIREARHLLGARLRSVHDIKPAVLHAASIPASFDARQQWPSCIHAIRNQEQCGSCWAFGATEAFSDRLCIATKGATNVVLSPQNLVSCDSSNFGCDGGYLDKAWKYMASSGVVADSCMPYTSGGGDTGKCPTKCKDGSALQPYKVKSSTIRTYTDVNSIATAIMTEGPVEGAFIVYQDFMSYSSGVYYHKTGSQLGGHAIKMLGWGTENGVDYWLCANSWGTSWGDKGFFKIRRGHNECQIESGVVAGSPA